MAVETQMALLRIGIFYPIITGWTAGTRHIRILVHSLSRVCKLPSTEVCILREQSDAPDRIDLPASVVPVPHPVSFPGEWRIRRLFSLPEQRSLLMRTAQRHGVSVLLPLRGGPPRARNIKTIGWIPDFQHVQRPEFFSEQERQWRNNTFQNIAERCSLVLLSSQNAVDHFSDLFPAYVHKARLSPFPSLFAFEPPAGDPLITVNKFNLPMKFALVANQFWRHKNHGLVIEALRELHCKGIRIPVVMTGLPADYRDRNNETMSRILQAIASAGLNSDVRVLGMIGDSDLGSLMRAAAVVIQPSLFEGWNLALQDARALARPIICSDIPVHREQVPEALGFFRPDRPDELADLLARNWGDFDCSFKRDEETRALTKEQEFARVHGLRLLDICNEALRQ